MNRSSTLIRLQSAAIIFLLAVIVYTVGSRRVIVAEARSAIQYKVVNVNITIGPNGEAAIMGAPNTKFLTIQGALNEYSPEGWELTSVVNVPPNTAGEGTYLIFKKAR